MNSASAHRPGPQGRFASVLMCALLALLSLGCAGSFELSPNQAVRMPSGLVVTNSGDVVEVPAEVKARVIPHNTLDYEVLMASDGRGRAWARRIPRAQVRAARKDGMTSGVVAFEGARSISSDGWLLYVRKPDGELAVYPLVDVKHVRLSDPSSRDAKIIGGVLGGVAGLTLVVVGTVVLLNSISYQ